MGLAAWVAISGIAIICLRGASRGAPLHTLSANQVVLQGIHSRGRMSHAPSPIPSSLRRFPFFSPSRGSRCEVNIYGIPGGLGWEGRGGVMYMTPFLFGPYRLALDVIVPSYFLLPYSPISKPKYAWRGGLEYSINFILQRQHNYLQYTS